VLAASPAHQHAALVWFERARAAELLRIKPTTLNEMIKRYDIRPRRKKASSGTPDPESGNGSENGDELEPVAEVD